MGDFSTGGVIRGLSLKEVNCIVIQVPLSKLIGNYKLQISDNNLPVRENDAVGVRIEDIDDSIGLYEGFYLTEDQGPL